MSDLTKEITAFSKRLTSKFTQQIEKAVGQQLLGEIAELEKAVQQKGFAFKETV